MRNYAMDLRTATPRFPGIGRYTRGLAEGMAGELAGDERLTLVLDADNPVNVTGARVASVIARATPFSMRQHREIPAILRSAGATLYHSAYILMPLTVRLPTVLTVYDALPLRLPGQATLRARMFFRVAMALALRRAGAVVVLSDAARADVAAIFPAAAGRMEVVAPGVGREFRPQDPVEMERVRRKYDLAGEYLLYVGSDRPHKNLARLREACAGLGAALALAGVREGRAEGVRPLGRVPDEDLPGLYAAAAAAVLPSLGEGFGPPVLEAMACGTPVACSDIPVLREVAGDAAAYFDPRQSGAIAGALRSMISDPDRRAGMAAAGLARARQFTWKSAAAATLAIYRRLCGEAHA